MAIIWVKLNFVVKSDFFLLYIYSTTTTIISNEMRNLFQTIKEISHYVRYDKRIDLEINKK